jgi:cytidyltransferase-like protein
MVKGLTIGVFDCFHEGHFNLLIKLRNKCDKLVVVVHDDYSTYLNKDRFPVQPLKQRIKNLKDVCVADKIIVCRKADPTYLIKKIRPDVYMRGDDWQDFPGREELEKQFVPVIFVPYTKGVSTTLRRDYVLRKPAKT